MTRLDQPSAPEAGTQAPERTPRPPWYRRPRWWIVGLVALVVVAGAVVGAVVGTSGSDKTATTTPSGPVATSLTTALTAEEQAKATYDNVTARFGDVQPFATVARAEADHASTLQGLGRRYGVNLPSGPFNGQPAPTTLVAACQLGVSTEQQIVSMYSGLLSQVSGHADLTRSFSNLQSAARDNHLPAFEACLSSTTSPAAPGSSPTTGASTSAGPVATALTTALTTEQQAKATYDNVIARFGDVQPFATVTSAEADHISALQNVAQRYGVVLPSGPFTGQPSPTTLTAACQLGVTTEQQIVSMYSQLLTQVSAYPDVTQALTNLQTAARDNHLPAFERCA